jgi:uncharacterized membrane protein
MDKPIVILFVLFETLAIGGLFLLYPRIARRGLLFGVYVGEERWAGDDARRIVRAWQRSILVLTLLCVTIGAILYFMFRNAAGLLAPLILLVGCIALYLRAYFQARELAVTGPPAAVAVMEIPEPPSRLPGLVLAAGIVGGLIAVSYAAMHYGDLPERVPTHFGPSGLPDAWRPKSFWTVMLSPLLTLVLGVGLGGAVILTSRAKRAIRFPQTRLSMEAQRRFRRAFTRFLALISLLTSVMLTWMSISATRVGMGISRSLSYVPMALTLCLVVVALAGMLYIAIRMGQGGARLERDAGNAPLTDGLADNRHWVLGAFYINKEDPSIFIEHRFGFGYTINFGNWKAVALLAAFLGTILGLVLIAILTG